MPSLSRKTTSWFPIWGRANLSIFDKYFNHFYKLKIIATPAQSSPDGFARDTVVQIFRHIASNPFEIRQYACGISKQYTKI